MRSAARLRRAVLRVQTVRMLAARVLAEHGVRAGSAEVLYLDAEGRLTKSIRVECSEHDVVETGRLLEGRGLAKAGRPQLPPVDRFRPRWTEK